MIKLSDSLNIIFGFYKWNQANIVVHGNNNYMLPFISCSDWMFQDIQDVAIFDVEQYFLERNSSFAAKVLVLLGVPIEPPHPRIVEQCVPNGITSQEMEPPGKSGRFSNKLQHCYVAYRRGCVIQLPTRKIINSYTP